MNHTTKQSMEIFICRKYDEHTGHWLYLCDSRDEDKLDKGILEWDTDIHYARGFVSRENAIKEMKNYWTQGITEDGNLGLSISHPDIAHVIHFTIFDGYTMENN